MTICASRCVLIRSQDDRFNKAVDKKTGYHTKSILCMPILNYEGEVIGVAQIMNKTDGTPEFTQQDEDVGSTNNHYNDNIRQPYLPYRK